MRLRCDSVRLRWSLWIAVLVGWTVWGVGIASSDRRAWGDERALPASAISSLRVTGESVWRADLGEGFQAYGFEGKCRAQLGTGEHPGKRIFALLRRTPGEPLELALWVDREGPAKPILSRHRLDQEPLLAAPLYRKRPDQLPPEIESLRRVLLGESEPGEELAGVVGGAGQAAAGDHSVVLAQQLEMLPPSSGAIGRPPELAPPTRMLPPAPGAMPTDTPPATSGSLAEGGLQFLVGGNQSIQFMPRGSTTPAQIQTLPLPQTGETAVVVRGGATVLVRDVSASTGTGTMLDLGTISISANNIVGWLPALSGLLGGSSSLADADGELYMEGDIVFRQGDRVIYADRMYYNISGRYGMILEAEAITPIPEYDGFVRLKADVLQQIAAGQFVAFGAAVTSSRMGVPRYWLQSERVEYRDGPTAGFDPFTGTPVNENKKTVSSRQNTVYINGFPSLYWPVFSSDLEKTNFYIRGLKVNNDSIFGTQVMADWDLFQLFGVAAPPRGVDWTLSTDYLSERGPALGTRLQYAVPGMFGFAGPTVGFIDAWGIYDEGLDTLGSDRRNLEFDEDFRGRVLMRHRHYLAGDTELIAEVGLLSDRNFLEQYFENEWDRDKDHDTSIRLRKYYQNNLFDLHADVRLNEFYTETNRLPQLDHYNVGSSWFGDWVNWTAHNKVGYVDLEVAEPPTNPAELAKFTLLPGEVDREGLVASTRQEIAMPLQAGPFKIVPFLSGEAATWGEAADSDSASRLLGQAGIRGALPAWRLYPAVSSSLLNIRGLAHKVEYRGEVFYADASENFEDLPLYDALDDDAQEQFRRRLIFNTFGGLPLPPQFDPRTYAIRSGMQRYVTAPSTEMADDLLQSRVGLYQRWQTKRGLPGRERIVDLARLDVSTLLFLEEDRDNFGETVGPTRYDFRYYAGDRVAFLSDGYFDWFDDGLRSVSAGVQSSRPGLGDAYLGILSLEGPISSTVLRGQLDYRLNEKWITSAGATFDLGETGNIGQQFALTRIGESMLVRLGLTVDAGRDNVGFQFLVEPRLWPGRRMGRLGGQLVPPPGIEGLE